MEEVRKWIQYWRNSLADGDRLEVNVDKVIAKSGYDLECLQSGMLPESLAKTFFQAKEDELNKRIKKKNKEKIKLQEIDVVLSTFHILPKIEHGIHFRPGNEEEITYPYWIPATLSRTGQLLPPEQPYPRVIRSVLEPIISEGVTLTISTVDKVDETLAEGSWDYPSWKAYWDYCQRFFHTITDSSLLDYKLPGYSIQHQGLIITDDQVRGASYNIIRLYDELRHRPKISPLLSTFIRSSPSEKHTILSNSVQKKLASQHLGHMNQAFALSPSQRLGLKHLQALEAGEILAVNGPPGTGKTTLLQSVVANLFVEKAIEGYHPPIIVASSTNNQAVTNIIDSFAKSQSKHGQLANRWLPEINSYAMYLPAASKAVSEDISYTKAMGGGLPEKVEQKAYWKKAKEYFLEQCYLYSQEEFEDTKTAASWFRHQLLEQKRHIDDVNHASEIIEFIRDKLTTYTYKGNAHLFVESLLNTGKIEREIALIQSHIDNIENFVEDFKTHSFNSIDLPRIKNLWANLLLSCPFIHSFNYGEFFANPLLAVIRLPQFLSILNEKLALLKDTKLSASTYRNWQEAESYHECVLTTEHYLDTGPRHLAFLLATHYWEARWLMEIEPLLEGDLLRRNGKGPMEKRWRRYAMLTPCFVSTFFMLPRFFQFTFYHEGYESSPMLGFIDLLIVDEAGQVPPEVAAASFSLAKKALIVGDIYQIQPIWKIPRAIDFANIERFKLIKNAEDLSTYNEYFRKGMLASSGSVMRIGLNTSSYNLPGRPEGGLFLAEHRRCYDEIISYCNQLAYRGDLLPLRGKSPQNIFPAFSYKNTPGTPQTYGGSRLNPEEAFQIVRWLETHRQIIEEYYQDTHSQLEDIVGILTPFAAQSRILRQVLRDANFNVKRMKAGTIHSLQGAERPIIIFSPVYGLQNVGKRFFFDHNIHMLNVAISRAQDSFIFFGDMQILDPFSGTPSGLLSTYLTKGESNNLDVWEEQKMNIV